MRKNLMFAATMALAMAASASQAAVIFSSYQSGPGAGEVLVTDFEGGPTLGGVTFNVAGYSLAGNAALFTGTQQGLSAAPAFSPKTRDTTQYLSVHRGQTATLDTPLLKAISFYVGSLDRYNSFTFHLANGATEVVTGAVLDALPGMDANGSWMGLTTNGRLTFSFNSAIDSVTFDSASNSLEISNIGAITAGIPEPATWAMMLAGFGGAGVLMRRRRSLRVA